jgi:hypothetical protein
MIRDMAMKSSVIGPATFNQYKVKCIVERYVEDGQDPFTSKIQLKSQLERRINGDRLIDFDILEELHFFQTHLAIFGSYSSLSLEKVVDGNSYHYVKIDFSTNSIQKINHETIDGEDWLVEETCRAKIVELEVFDKYLPKPLEGEYDATETYS